MSNTPETSPAAQALLLYALDKDRLSAFYAHTLGLAVAEQASTHDLLLGAGIELVIHAIPARYTAGITITQPPQVREATPMKPVFRVASLASARLAALAHGGGFKPLDQAWAWRGQQVLDGHDPEGNVLQLRQLLAVPPSATATATATPPVHG